MTENGLRLGGGVVFWSLGEWTSRDLLATRLELIDLGGFTPEARTPAAALRDALHEVYPGATLLVRPLTARDGFAVVEESRGEFRNEYHHVCTARIDAALHITVSGDAARTDEVVDAFNRHLGLLRAAQVTGCLTAVVGHLGGTTLKPTGGIYWLPEGSLPRWALVAQAVTAAGANSRCYTLRHRMDHEAVRAVRDAIVAEVEGESRRIHDEVVSGGLGGRALAHRQMVAEALREKIRLYEDLLGVGLAGLHQAVDVAEQAAAGAALLAGAQL